MSDTDNQPTIFAHVVTETIQVAVVTFNGVDIAIKGCEDFEELLDDLCDCDGFVAIRGIADKPIVQALISAGLVSHSQSRGCYATDLLREHKAAILAALSPLYQRT